MAQKLLDQQAGADSADHCPRSRGERHALQLDKYRVNPDEPRRSPADLRGPALWLRIVPVSIQCRWLVEDATLGDETIAEGWASIA